MKLSAPPPPPPPPPEPPAPGDQPPQDPNANANPGISALTPNPGADAPTPPQTPQTPAADASGSPQPSATPETEPSGSLFKQLQWPTWYPGVDATIAGLVLLAAFAAASFVARNSDVYLHLAAGQRLFKGEYFPGGSDPFSYSGADRTWVNHSWLTDAVSYALYGNEGLTLSIAKALVVTLAFGLLLAIRRPQFSLWPWAVAAGIGVLASAPQLTLRPHVVSMLFLAITLFILFRMPRGTNPWRFPVAIGVTFWLWANCDSWFILGPIVLALVIVGELIQQNMFPSAESPESEAENEPLGRLPDVRTLAKALGIGVVACMLNPHHVLVWQLPFELSDMPDAALDMRLRIILMPVYDDLYFSRTALGNNANGFAFVILGVLGLVTGVLALSGITFGRLRVAHGVLLVAFLLMACFRVAAIPFFAILAVPFIAAELNGLSSRIRLKTSLDSTSRLLLIGSSLGRVACVLGVAAMCVVAYPGWLHPENPNPAFARRVAWGVEPDPMLVRVSQQLDTWRAEEKLPPDSRGIVANTDLANYIAWYAPREKVYINARFNFHKDQIDNYVKLRRGLGLVVKKDEPFSIDEMGEIMKNANADYLAVSANAHDNSYWAVNQAAGKLYARWQGENAWSPWYLDGHTILFGFRSTPETSKPEFTALRVDPVALAFAPGTPIVPKVDLKQPLLQLESKWQEEFLRPANPTPPEAAEALGWVDYQHSLQPRLQQRQILQNRAQVIRALRTQMLLTGTPDVPHELAIMPVYGYNAMPTENLPPPPSPEPSGDIMAARAAPILALRAARRAIQKDEDQPEPYFVLARALDDPHLPLSDSERILGIAIAHQQCLSRLPRPEFYRKGQFVLPAKEVALSLAHLYLGRSLKCRVAVIKPDNPKIEPRPVLVGTMPAERNAKAGVTRLASQQGNDPQFGSFRATGYDVVIPYLGMPIGSPQELPGISEAVADMVVIRPDASGNLNVLRVPVTNYNPNDPGQVTVAGPTMLPLDTVHELFKSVIEYAKKDLAGEGTDELSADAKKELEDLDNERKAVQSEYVKMEQIYQSAETSAGGKFQIRFDTARRCNLLEKARELLKDSKNLDDELKDQSKVYLLNGLNMELALGHIENVDNWLYSSDGFGTAEKMAEWDKKADRAASADFANLSQAEKMATVEAIGIRARLRQLMYQEALQAGNYARAGEILEQMEGKGIGSFDKFPPPGPNVPEQRILNNIVQAYQTREPKKLLEALTRPPLLVPMPPLLGPAFLIAQAENRKDNITDSFLKQRYQPLSRDLWLSDWFNLTAQFQQQMANQLQAESRYFYRRGILLVLEGDILAAKRRFQDATRKAPEGWGVPGVINTDANSYLQMIEIAEKKAVAK